MSGVDPQPDDEPLFSALRVQSDALAHDRSLILERLSWTPEQRLHANTAFVRFYRAIRPEGPLIGGE